MTLTRREVLAGAAGLGCMLACAGCGDAPPTPVAADLGPADQVPVGSGRVFSDAGVVVTQPTAGDYRAFSATCTHQGCTVTDVADGTINCPCHGSKFAIADGAVVDGPALEPLPRRTVTVRGGTLRFEP